ncbi:MAG: helix-turn-helix domain-containing protein [Oscillospiraceae bacterium]|nr:helix-turn-helix domain-containing protein [Oscillospiraceae bacterium]
MRIAIDAPAVRSLSANEKMVYQMLKEGKTPREIAKKLHLALGDVTDLKYNSHDVMPDTVVNLITSIREKGWDIPTDNKEDNEMARKSRFDAEEKRSIVTEYRSGATMAQIAKKHDTVKSTVYSIVRDYNEHGDAAFAPITDEELERAYGNDTPCYEVTGDTDMGARIKEEPETAATESGSEQENIPNIPADIVTPSEENVKNTTAIPQSVKEACWERIANLKEQIAAEQSVIDDWTRQVEEIEVFLDLNKE